MRPLVRKMTSFGILKVQMIVSAIVMIVAMFALPVGLMIGEPSLLIEPYIIGAIVVVMLIFGAFAYFLSIRPYFLYRKLPEVLAETDGEYLYLHGKKEAKIPLSELDGTSTFVHLPFLYSNELIAVLLTHLLSEKYGDLDLDVPGYGNYKLRFVSDVQTTADELMAFINEVLNND